MTTTTTSSSSRVVVNSENLDLYHYDQCRLHLGTKPCVNDILKYHEALYIATRGIDDPESLLEEREHSCGICQYFATDNTALTTAGLDTSNFCENLKKGLSRLTTMYLDYWMSANTDVGEQQRRQAGRCAVCRFFLTRSSAGLDNKSILQSISRIPFSSLTIPFAYARLVYQHLVDVSNNKDIRLFDCEPIIVRFKIDLDPHSIFYHLIVQSCGALANGCDTIQSTIGDLISTVAIVQRREPQSYTRPEEQLIQQAFHASLGRSSVEFCPTSHNSECIYRNNGSVDILLASRQLPDMRVLIDPDYYTRHFCSTGPSFAEFVFSPLLYACGQWGLTISNDQRQRRAQIVDYILERNKSPPSAVNFINSQRHNGGSGITGNNRVAPYPQLASNRRTDYLLQVASRDDVTARRKHEHASNDLLDNIRTVIRIYPSQSVGSTVTMLCSDGNRCMWCNLLVVKEMRALIQELINMITIKTEVFLRGQMDGCPRRLPHRKKNMTTSRTQQQSNMTKISTHRVLTKSDIIDFYRLGYKLGYTELVDVVQYLEQKTHYQYLFDDRTTLNLDVFDECVHEWMYEKFPYLSRIPELVTDDCIDQLRRHISPNGNYICRINTRVAYEECDIYHQDKATHACLLPFIAEAVALGLEAEREKRSSQYALYKTCARHVNILFEEHGFRIGLVQHPPPADHLLDNSNGEDDDD